MATLIEDYSDAAIAPIDFMDDLSVGSAINDEAFDNMDDIFTSTKQGPATPVITAERAGNNTNTLLQANTPRMVSLPSMSRVRSLSSGSSSRKRSLATPYDSLKELVKSKQQHRSGINNFASIDNKGTFPVVKPSDFLRQALYKQQPQQQSLFKRHKIATEDTSLIPVGESELHRACAAGNVEEIVKALEQDRVQAARAVRITSTKNMYNPSTYKMEEQQVQENYTFALNLAIRAKTSPEILEKLAKAAPGVLAEKDGDAQECALAVLFKTSPTDMVTADKFLLQNPDCARVTDRKHNTVLHMACQNGASLDTIRHLVILYPEALFLYNAHGETPVQLAQRCIHRCSNEVATYLWQKQADSF
mmetsp:Transcript_2035/g.4440  ORF Transcript_2035/g.4440 Transcript_2035/m.4440 type:complete len:362 (+) Transcript_2035:90-1175(+)